MKITPFKYLLLAGLCILASFCYAQDDANNGQFLQLDSSCAAFEFDIAADAPPGLKGPLKTYVDSFSSPAFYEVVNKWMNTNYRYGGNSSEGIDCSGFAKKVYSSCYQISLKGGSADIYKDVKSMPVERLSEGDLLFFKIYKKRISHVAVYLGNNKFVHATTRHGVIISDLDEPYYKKHFFAGGRHKQLVKNDGQ